MIEEIEIVEPKEFQHNKLTIDKLFSIVDTDYYGRYNFNDLQKYSIPNGKSDLRGQEDQNECLGS